MKTPYNSSWLWKGIMNSAELIIRHLRWRIGNGSSIPLNHHLWWPMQSRSTAGDLSSVQDLIVHTNVAFKPLQWNSLLIRELYDPVPAQAILNSSFSFTDKKDSLSWQGHPSGTYTARSGFHLSCNYDTPLIPNPFWKFLWSINLPPKNCLFTWKLLHKGIPCSDILNNHHLVSISSCPFGCDTQETINHLFFECPFSRAIWWGYLDLRVD